MNNATILTETTMRIYSRLENILASVVPEETLNSGDFEMSMKAAIFSELASLLLWEREQYETAHMENLLDTHREWMERVNGTDEKAVMN